MKNARNSPRSYHRPALPSPTIPPRVQCRRDLRRGVGAALKLFVLGFASGAGRLVVEEEGTNFLDGFGLRGHSLSRSPSTAMFNGDLSARFAPSTVSKNYERDGMKTASQRCDDERNANENQTGGSQLSPFPHTQSSFVKPSTVLSHITSGSADCEELNPQYAGFVNRTERLKVCQFTDSLSFLRLVFMSHWRCGEYF